MSEEDRLRRAIIERLMCDFAVDLERECEQFGISADRFAPELEALRPFQADGLVSMKNLTVQVELEGQSLVRAVCAIFDTYLAAGKGRHSRAI